MNRKIASLIAAAVLTVIPVAVGAERGGAIPQNLSFYDSNEFTDVQLSTGRDAQPIWGSLVLEGTAGLRFVPDNGVEVTLPYPEIKAIKYERVVKEKEKPAADQKWIKKAVGFARGVDTYRVITIEHRTADGEARVSSKLRVDELNAVGILRVLEMKTGLRVKKLSNL